MGARSLVVKVFTAVVIASMAFVATGCKPEVTKEVLFVNDSVTHQSIIQLVSEFNIVKADSNAGRYAPNFGSSEPGIGLLQVPLGSTGGEDGYWTADLSSLISHVRPEVMVVELGYNDCGYDLTNYGAHIDNFMANIPPETPVHWLTIADASNSRPCDETINAALNEALTRWPNLSLLDFGAHMAGHPEWYVDNVHLNPDGQHEYAIWLHQQLDAIYNAPH